LPRSQHLLAHWRVRTADGWPCFDVVHRKALPARACSELRLAGAHAVDNARGRQPGDSVQPEPPSTSPADDNPRSAAGRESSNVQMLSAGHIEETEMLQDSEQQTRAPSTCYRRPNAQLQWTRSSRRLFSWVLGRKRHLLPGNRGGARVASEHAAG